MNKCDKCGCERNTANAKYCCECGYELPKPMIEEVIVSEPVKKIDTKKLIGIIVGAITFFIAYFLVQQLFFNTSSFDRALMEAASEINKSCPIMMDSETRLDNTITLPPKIFQYNYTLVNYSKETIDTLYFKNYLEPTIKNFVRTNPDMKFQRDNKVTISYYYKDKEGNYLFTIFVTPEDYN